MPQFLQSRKLWAAMIGLILIIVNAALNQQQVDPNTLTNAVMGIIAAYLAATAYEDGETRKAAAMQSAAKLAAAQLTESQLAAPKPVVVNVAAPGEPNITVTTTPSDTPAPPFVDHTGLR